MLLPPVDYSIHTPKRGTWIVAAAIRQDGVVYEGPRHHLIIRQMVHRRGVKPPVRGEQGFVTNYSDFVDREEGARVAIRAGQITETKYSEGELFSEELWPWQDNDVIFQEAVAVFLSPRELKEKSAKDVFQHVLGLMASWHVKGPMADWVKAQIEAALQTGSPAWNTVYRPTPAS